METAIDIGTQFQFIFEINHFSFGVDGLSIYFVLLTTFITPIAIFSSYDLFVSSLPSLTNNSPAEEVSPNPKNILKLKIFLISLLLLEALQICAFVSLDLLLFYIFFESVK
jgi:NADH-ubiquinone oxidoreductase chain 4